MEQSSPKPIPDGPTHCRGCSDRLEPLRRWGGLCRVCVRNFPRLGLRRRRSDPDAFKWRELKRFVRKRPNGVNETCVRVKCQCEYGTERTMSVTEFEQRRSNACNRCKLKAIRAYGVESDYAK